MIRLILVLILIWLVVRVGRSVINDLRLLARKQRQKSSGKTEASVPDKLVQDPVCGVYCPKSSAYTAIWQGKVYYFCSEECRQKFLKKASSSSS